MSFHWTLPPLRPVETIPYLFKCPPIRLWTHTSHVPSTRPTSDAYENTTVNGAITFQTIHGLGVNANPQSWNVNPEAVKKVLDDLITGVGCTSFRLMYDDCDWEQVNDNDDPHSYNWKYYDSVYSAPRFTCVWADCPSSRPS